MPWVTEGRRTVWEHLTATADEEADRRADFRRWERVRPRRYGQDAAVSRWYANRYDNAPRPDPNASGDPWPAATSLWKEDPCPSMSTPS